MIMFSNLKAMNVNHSDNLQYSIASKALEITWICYFLVYTLLIISLRLSKLNNIPSYLTYNVSRLVGRKMSEGQLRSLIKNKAETPPFIIVYGEAGHDHRTIYKDRYGNTLDKCTNYVKTFEIHQEFRFQTWEPSYYIPELNPDESLTVNISTSYCFTPQSTELLNDAIHNVENIVRGRDSHYSVKWEGNLPNYHDEFIKVGDPGGYCRSCLFEFGYISLFVWVIMLILGLSTVFEASMLRNIREEICPINKFIDIGDSYHALYGQKCIIKSDRDLTCDKSHSDVEHTSNHDQNYRHHQSHKGMSHKHRKCDDDEDSSFSSGHVKEEL